MIIVEWGSQPAGMFDDSEFPLVIPLLISQKKTVHPAKAIILKKKII